MLSVGLVGLPNAGKSSLFNLLTKRQVPAENYPFCTIDPHTGTVEVPDPRVDKLALMFDSQKKIYSLIEFQDIAGLVKNASKGEGLGNQFLSHIRETDMILMVLRSFYNDDIIHVENRVNPIEDEEILMLELTLSDQTQLENLMPKLEKELKLGKDRLIKDKLNLAEKLMTNLSEFLPANQVPMPSGAEPEFYKWRKSLNLLTDKPILRLSNINLDGKNYDYNADFQMDIKLEASLADMSSQDRVELGYSSQTGLDGLIRACYKQLGLGTFLTAGPIEARSWTFNIGWPAPKCASVIHTDFEKKFIKAEVIGFSELEQIGSFKSAKEQGKLRIEGKNYEMKDGDVVEFIIN